MDDKQFNILAPITIQENETIYNEQLDFAMNLEEKRIKNIGISGVYGAGKSTVWNTYIKNKDIKNIISISLAKYNKPSDQKTQEIENELVKENRIERQIINQIVSQVEQNSIPLYFNKIKENKTINQLILYSFFAIIFVMGVIGLFVVPNIDLFIEHIIKYILIAVFSMCIITPFLFIFWKLIKYNTFNNFELKMKYFKARFNNIDGSKEESIFDKYSNEIIYLLYYSNTSYVVFEDLDRYENIEVFKKLKQLNTLLNNYHKTKKTNKTVKFIYIVSDQLFDNQSKTKFFDFNVHIIPIKTSTKFLKNQLQKININDDNYIKKYQNF
ncbi:YobI family P-loop NTPase [Mycoplasma mycoides]|uniref:YobI family P-loop NTPase n=1 Tax=Mycoplasma mycoides TaxID=2102 RepID=UPI00223F31C6|nr:hypothetical protein [Mycoplasma mycoides]QVK08254.1 hypothetical protein I7644_02790 [Mycoplasma mycoides subsp. capri]